MLKEKIKHCDICRACLPYSPKPILQFARGSKVVVIGQAPGRLAHDSGIPWNDKSGDRLRAWFAMDKKTFYDGDQIALVPMGLCFPGTGKSGDLPPRKECAPLWHPQILREINAPALKILIGSYAQNYYLNDKKTLTKRCKQWQDYQPEFLVLPHPSPRNNIWLKKNPWFETEVIPIMRDIVRQRLS